MIGPNGPRPLKEKGEARVMATMNHYGVISAIELDTPLNGATTILTGLEASPYPLGVTMSFGAQHATELDTPPIHAMPLPSK
jgi:hypothetical protein